MGIERTDHDEKRHATALFLRYRDGGDVEALAELFDVQSPELFRVAQHVSRDAAEAEDLVQAAFLTAMEHPDRFEASRSVSAWLAGILSKEALAWSRSAARRPDIERVLEGRNLREEQNRPDIHASSAETQGLLDAALRRLPDRYRDVLERHLCRGQSPSEIAADKGASPVTVRVQLHRGLAQLRLRLPAGAAAILPVSLPARGLSAVRSELIVHAHSHGAITGLAAGAIATSTLPGPLPGFFPTLLMLQRITLGAVALLVLVFTVRFAFEARSAPLDQPAIEVSSTISGPLAADDPRADTASLEPVSTLRVPAQSGAEDSTRLVSEPLLVRTFWADGSVAPNIGFHYANFGDADSKRRGMTDDKGQVLLEGLDPGYVAFYGDRGGHGSAQPRAVQVSSLSAWPFPPLEVRLQLESGHDVLGRVVDANGRGVADADVWVTTGITRSTGHIVARTAADGAFSAEQLSSACLFGARASGYAPSSPEHVQYWSERADGDAPIQVTLELPGATAWLSGRVLDPAGAPVAGARVRVGPQAHFDSFGPTGAAGPPPPVELLTDSNGAFESDRATPGEVEWSVKCGTYAVLSGKVEVAAGESGKLEVQLAAGGRVVGQIKDPTGAPLPGLTVAAYQSSFRYPNSQTSFSEPRTTTDADGRFELSTLAAGKVRLTATTADRKSSCEATLDVAPGKTYAWDDVITDLPVVSGRAMSASGEPLAGWTVTSDPTSGMGSAPRATFVREDGAFELITPGRGSVRLELYAPAKDAPDDRTWATSAAPRAWVDEVSIGTTDVLIVPSADQEPRSTLRGTFVPTLGSSTPKTLVTARHSTFGEVARIEFEEGTTAFELPAMPQGDITIEIEPIGFARMTRTVRDLVQGGEHDLGELVISHPGSLRVTMRLAGGGEVRSADVSLTDSQGGRVNAPLKLNVLERDGLAAGTYTLRIQAQDCGPLIQKVSVRADEETLVEAVLPEGGSVGVALLGVGKKPLMENATLRVSTADGTVLIDEELEPHDEGHVGRFLFAPYGVLRITATCVDGRTGEAEVRFGPTEDAERPHAVILK